MKHSTKLKIAAVHQWCDAEDRSTEYTIQLIKDTCGVSLETFVTYWNLGTEEHKELFKQVNSVCTTIEKLTFNLKT